MWWKIDKKAYDVFCKELDRFNSLTSSVFCNKVIVEGLWHVYGENSLITSYKIKIVTPDRFPDEAPLVFEVGGRIPKNQTHHFNPKDASACLFARPERWEKWPIGSNIGDFLNGPVKEFFFSQAYFELKNSWPFGEWRHGNDGVIEYYQDRLSLINIEQIIKCLKLMREDKLQRQWRCPCNKSNRLIKCHGSVIAKLKNILPREEIESAIALFEMQPASL